MSLLRPPLLDLQALLAGWFPLLLFAGTLLLLSFSGGGVELEIQYWTYLFLTFVLLPLLLAQLARPSISLQVTLGASVLLALSLLVLLQPSFQARGFLLVALGWQSFLLVQLLAARRPSFLVALAVLLFLVTLIQAAYALFQFLQTRPALPAASGSFVNRNHLAGFLNLGFFLGLGLLFHVLGNRSRPGWDSETWGKAWILLLTTGMTGAATLLSTSRAGLASLLSGLAVFLLALRMARGRPWGRSLPPLLALLLLVLLLATPAGLLDLTGVRLGESDLGQEDRITLFSDTLRLISAKPLLGFGPAQFEWHYRPLQSLPGNFLYQHAHNDFLESAVEWGIPLASAFWMFVLYAMCRGLGWKSRQEGRTFISLGAAAGVLALLIHSLFDFNLHIPSNLMLFFALLALGWPSPQSGGEAPS